MNDRFKFRVWLPFEKRMITTDNESFFALNQHGSLLKINDKNEAFFARIGHTFSKENIMQCTGLKDKNGKLIYEGDIIRDEHSEAVAIIEWLSYAYSLMAHVRGMDDYLPLEDICYALEVATPFEVIGNIYENKELLND